MKNYTYDANQTNYFNVNWDEYTEYLSKIAIDEPWTLKTYRNRGILRSYISNTCQKLKRENGIVETEEYALFNTGLYSKCYEPIYAYQTRRDRVQFYTDYELCSLSIPERPERANYFADPGLLLFDWHYKINIHYSTILDNPKNMALLPDEVANAKNLEILLDGSILQMCRRVSANYKLAIPQYRNNGIQLLLPLCLISPTKADLAVVAVKYNGYYQCNTYLSLEDAYNNARLIARPENNWLSIKHYEAPTAEERLSVDGNFGDSRETYIFTIPPSQPESHAVEEHEDVTGQLGDLKEMTVHTCIFKSSKQEDRESISVVKFDEDQNGYKTETISF